MSNFLKSIEGHTPGPWVQHPTKKGWSNMIIGKGKYIAVGSMTQSSNSGRITPYQYLHHERNEGEIMANSNLLVKSYLLPDIYKLLEDAFENIGYSEEGDRRIREHAKQLLDKLNS